MRHDYRWELWIVRAHEDEAQEDIEKFCDGNFLRGPNIPATDHSPERIVLILDAAANRKGVKELDEFVTRLADHYKGHAWRTASKTLLITQSG
jgi:hypothetical protein